MTRREFLEFNALFGAAAERVTDVPGGPRSVAAAGDGCANVGGPRSVAAAGDGCANVGGPRSVAAEGDGCANVGGPRSVAAADNGCANMGGPRSVAAANGRGTNVGGPRSVAAAVDGCANLGGPRSVAAEADATERVPLRADATERVPPRADATERVPPVRKCPSKNSVLVPRDDRAIVLFVTVNTNLRQPVFANDQVVDCILSAWNKARNWLVGRYVIMPDHIHFFCTPGLSPVPDFHRWIAYWKSLVARCFPCAHELPLWQRECWDVQMRTADNYREKWNYIRNNPVRKGLVENADDWPYQGFQNILAWHD